MAQRRITLPLAFALLCFGVLTPTPAQAAGSIQPSTDPLVLGRAMMGDVSWVTSGALLNQPSPDPMYGWPSAGITSGNFDDLPTTGDHALVLSTGAVQDMTDFRMEIPIERQGTGPIRGNSDYDATVLRIDLDVPETANCLVGMDFRFYTNELGFNLDTNSTVFDDAFIAELDESTWTTHDSVISAPRNFAVDPAGNPISVNGVADILSEDESVDTTFRRATPLLTAATPITPGAHSLYLSIFDQTNGAIDSAVIVDNLRLGHVSDVATECAPGGPVAGVPTYVGLGDSYSSGFGVAPYAIGTHQDAGDNDCQRSTRAYAEVVATKEDIDLAFHACQGAVTRDFYQRRNSTWGEAAQLDYLSQSAELVTFSIGGNDAKFADVLAECILGMELLPFNTCYHDKKVLRPIREAMDRLDGRTTTPTEITPYNTLYEDVRDRAGVATVVAVGYPHFFRPEGGGPGWLPGSRCEGVKKVDQRWMVEKIDELNAIIARNAARNGFLFANPNPSFDGHELCGSTGDEWIFPLLSSGRIHPTAAGQSAIADAVVNRLDATGFESMAILPGQTLSYGLTVDGPREFISVVTGWPGSDVSLTLTSPSGRVIDRGTAASDVRRITGATHEKVEVDDPEVGTWTVEVTGLDVADGGEPVTLSMYQAPDPNERPIGRIEVHAAGDELIFDGSSSSDPDGSIESYDWYVSDDDTDEVFTGSSMTLPKDTLAGRSVTLVVTDDRGLTDFTQVRMAPIDVMPGSDVNPIKVSSKGVTPVAILSTESLDATLLDTSAISAGPGEAPVEHSGGHLQDVNGDGRTDLVVHFKTQALGLTRSDSQLCVRGTLTDSTTFDSCDVIKAK